MSAPFLGELCRPRVECSLCRTDGTALELCVRLPPTPLANSFETKGAKDAQLFPLDLVMCLACRHIQLGHIVKPELLFTSYLYETSTSEQTLAHLREEAASVIKKIENPQPTLSVIEIGSNDGAFLKELIALGMTRDQILGIEPSETMSKKAIEAGIPTMRAFFGKGIRPKLVKNHDAIVANNVLAHVPSVRDVLDEIPPLLGPKGFLVMEVGNAADVIRGAFDVVYHEHMSYHSLAPLRRALEDVGLPMFDVENLRGEVGRGSLRVWAGRGRSPSKRMLDALEEEEKLELDDPRLWRKKLGTRKGSVVGATKNAIDNYIARWKRTKLTPVIVGYGAPAKLTTLTYACDLRDVSAIVEDSPWKIGKATPGRGIPIVSRKEALAMKPDSIIVYAWNFADRIAKRLRAEGYLGEIFVPLPKPRFIEVR